MLGTLADRRLLTLTGAPGCGKSRLGLRFAQSRPHDAAERIWWIDLAAVKDGSTAGANGGAKAGLQNRVEAEVRRMLGLPADGRRAEIVSALRSCWRPVLVVDNCEHVLVECAELVQALLVECPDLQVIATSREALRIPGEVVFRVGPLPVPDSLPAEPDHWQLLQSDAVRLFVERASAGNPDFALSPANAASVVELCTELDGLPLAIELAARRVGVLSVADLLARLRRSTAVLSADGPTAQQRHATLRAAFDASYAGLSPQERTALRRLSILPPGFDLDVACAVVRTRGQTEQEAVDVVCRLRSRSLLEVESVEDRTRLRLLTTVRTYAGELLRETDEADAAWDGLVGWLVRRAQPLRATIATPGPGSKTLSESLYQYLLAGAEWTAKRDDPRHVELVVALAQIRRARRATDMTSVLIRHALATCRGVDRALLLIDLAHTRRESGSPLEAFQAASEAAWILRKQGPRALHARALLALSACHRDAGALSDAYDAARKALRIARSLEEGEGIALGLDSLATVQLAAGRLDAAALLINEALEAAALPEVLCTAADIALAVGHPACAQRHARQAMVDEPPEPARLYRPLLRLAGAAIRTADRERALHLVGVARAMHAQAGRIPGSVLDREREAELEGWVARLSSPDAMRVEKVTALASRDTAHGLAAAETGLRAVAAGPDDAEGRLSERQRTIAGLVADGLTNRQIASRIGASPRTVAALLAQLRRELSLQSRAQVAVWARGWAGVQASLAADAPLSRAGRAERGDPGCRACGRPWSGAARPC